jgi:hypothetical protein
MLHEENEEKERDGGVEKSKKNLIPFSLQVVLICFQPRTQSSAHPTFHRRPLFSV